MKLRNEEYRRGNNSNQVFEAGSKWTSGRNPKPKPALLDKAENPIKLIKLNPSSKGSQECCIDD